jgi:ribosome maturation factor RimP
MVALFLYPIIMLLIKVSYSAFYILYRQVFLNKETGNKLLDDVESLVNNLGFSVVEINSSTNRNRFKINLIVYSDQGVKIDDCSIIHKTIFPRLEVIYDKFDVYLEVSSPGIERSFKDAREFEVFKGKAVKIMHGENNDWEQGFIVSTEDDSVVINFSENNQIIKFKDVQKCRLDYLKEVRKS